MPRRRPQASKYRQRSGPGSRDEGDCPHATSVAGIPPNSQCWHFCLKIAETAEAPAGGRETSREIVRDATVAQQSIIASRESPAV
jgi:hypothetical protein